MANVDASFGLRAIQGDRAAGQSGKVRKYAVASTDTVPVFKGDPVQLTGTSVADANGDVIPYVARATAGDTGSTAHYATGVVVDVVAATEASTTYIAASTGGYVLVNDDPEQLFEIQVDGALAVTDVGNTAPVVFTNAGSTVTGHSGAELDSSLIGNAGAGATMLTIEGVRQQDRNDLTADNAVAIVRINRHQKRNTSGVYEI